MIDLTYNPFLPDQDPKIQKTAIGPSMATVVEVMGDGSVTLDLPTAIGTSKKSYRVLAHYTPSRGDRVYVVPISGTYLVIGKVN